MTPAENWNPSRSEAAMTCASRPNLAMSGRHRRLLIALVAGEHEHAVGGHDDAGRELESIQIGSGDDMRQQTEFSHVRAAPSFIDRPRRGRTRARCWRAR